MLPAKSLRDSGLGSCLIQFNISCPGESADHSGLAMPTLTDNQDTLPQTRWQVNLIWTIPQSKLTFQEIPSFVKLPVKETIIKITHLIQFF